MRHAEALAGEWGDVVLAQGFAQARRDLDRRRADLAAAHGLSEEDAALVEYCSERP